MLLFEIQFLTWALCLWNLAGATETVYDAARIARTLIQASPSVATMSTLFPPSHSLAGQPFSLQEYYAGCMSNGSLSLIFFPIAQHGRNILASEGTGVSIAINSQAPSASRPRLSLIGNVTIQHDDVLSSTDLRDIEACYLDKHPDSKWWLPGGNRDAHTRSWARFDPHTIYFVGGFGGAHFIGYIPLEIYQEAVPMDDIEPFLTTSDTQAAFDI